MNSPRRRILTLPPIFAEDPGTNRLLRPLFRAFVFKRVIRRKSLSAGEDVQGRAIRQELDP